MDDQNMQRFENEVLDFIAARLAVMGMEDSGLLAYYAQRVEKRRALTRYERDLADYLNGDQFIIHAGIGIGVLSVALALQGSRVIGFEFEPRRHAAAVALKARVAPAAEYEVRLASFPQGLGAEDNTASATLLFTNVASTWPEALYEAVFASMPRFRRTILDLRVFGHTRNEVAEREQLAGRLTRAGLTLTPLSFQATNSFYVEASAR